jgi:hypothetical protein
VNKQKVYSILLIIGLLYFFFAKNKFSSKSEGANQYSQFSDQIKSVKSPSLYFYFCCADSEEDDELSHVSKSTILLFFLHTFILKSIIIFSKIKFRVRSTFGIPTYLRLKNFRI